MSLTGNAFLGQRFWPGRYVLTLNGRYWTGRIVEVTHDGQYGPHTTATLERARVFVSARHAYENARVIPGLQDWMVKRIQTYYQAHQYDWNALVDNLTRMPISA
jgi:hypothetical protein